MTYNITKEEEKKIKNIKGEVRGAVFLTDKSFILQKGGEAKLKQVEEELAKNGFPIFFENIRAMEFFPYPARIFSIIVTEKVLDLGREGVKEMGINAPKMSFLIKFFTNYFLSISKTLEKTGEIWSKHATTGTVKLLEVNEEEKYAVFTFQGVYFPEIYCDYLTAYLGKIISMALGAKKEARTEWKTESEENYRVKVSW